MRISGLQKMTLLDYPGKIACTVFLGGCNFRCPFCHNGELLDGSGEPVMDEQEFLGFLSKRKGLLDAVCISGGEPTLQAGLADLLEKIKKMGYLTKLDTNSAYSTYSYEISLPKDIVNLSSFTKAVVKVNFIDFATVSVTAADFVCANVPEGFSAEVLTESLHVTLCGAGDDVSELSGEEIEILLDLSTLAAEEGHYTLSAEITVKSDKSIGVLGSYEAQVALTANTESEEPAA